VSSRPKEVFVHSYGVREGVPEIRKPLICGGVGTARGLTAPYGLLMGF
jgi:hypothetical protein